MVRHSDWFYFVVPAFTTVTMYLGSRKDPTWKRIAMTLLGFAFGGCAAASGYFHKGAAAIAAFLGCACVSF